MRPLDSKPRKMSVALIAIVLVASGCAGSAPSVSETGGTDDPAIVRGRIVLPEDAVIPRGAVAIARLLDVSRQDVPAEILAEHSWPLTDRDVLDFELPYDPDAIEDWRTYTVQVRVEVDGTLHMISTTAVQVISRGRPHEVEIPVEPIR